MDRMTYQWRIRNRADAVLEFSVEEIAETLVLGQVFYFNLFQVAAEGGCVKTKTDGSKPNGQFERVDVSP